MSLQVTRPRSLASRPSPWTDHSLGATLAAMIEILMRTLAGNEGRSRPSEEQREAVAELRSISHPTRCANVRGLEEVLHEALPVLDHGALDVVSDSSTETR